MFRIVHARGEEEEEEFIQNRTRGGGGGGGVYLEAYTREVPFLTSRSVKRREFIWKIQRARRLVLEAEWGVGLEGVRE